MSPPSDINAATAYNHAATARNGTVSIPSHSAGELTVLCQVLRSSGVPLFRVFWPGSSIETTPTKCEGTVTAPTKCEGTVSGEPSVRAQ